MACGVGEGWGVGRSGEVEEASSACEAMDAAAWLLVELDGWAEAVGEQVDKSREACTSCGEREVRVAQSAEERDLLWKGRKNAFGAVGRVSAFYYVRIIVNMYLRDDRPGDEAKAASPIVTWAIYLTFAGTVIIGIIPWVVTNLSDRIAMIGTIIH